MKKRLLLVFLLPIIGFSQMRNILNSTDLNGYGLKGNIKEVTFKEYEPRFSNDSIYNLELCDFPAVHKYKVEFNKFGNLKTKYKLIKYNDSIKVGAIWQFKYDKINRILSEKKLLFRYSRDTIIWNYEYFGDSIINI
jgi:hypothetical protein